MSIERVTAPIQPNPSECKSSSYFRAMEFLRTAIREEAHLKQPEGASGETWIKERNLVGVDWGTPKTHRTIGEIYHLSESRVTQIVKRGMLHLWGNCSEETQKQFPEEEIKAFKKPRGTALAITRRVESGVTNRRLVKEFGEKNIRAIRKILGDVGVNLPLNKRGESRVKRQELKDRLENEEDDQKVQAILNQLHPTFARRHLRGIVMPLGDMLFELAGTHTKQLSSIADKLRALGIPVGTVCEQVSTDKQKTRTYHLVRVKEQNRIWWLLQSRESLKTELTRLIKKICGPQNAAIPNTTQLQNGERYRPIGYFLNKLKIDRTHQKRFRELILATVSKEQERCPISIFQYGNSFYYPVAQESELRSFLITQVEAITQQKRAPLTVSRY